MKRLNDELKRILDGLASQDAGEYLTMDEKLRFVGEGKQTPPPVPERAPAPPARRIAVVLNKGDTNAALHHALQACQRLGARLDVLVNAPAGHEHMARLKATIQRAGIAFQVVTLSGPMAWSIADYAERSRSLVYLVAAVDDPDVGELVEETLPAHRRNLPVPIVLIGDSPSQRHAAARVV